MKHPLMPWIVRCSAYIGNRYAVHSNGCTSYFNRWNREQHTPLCEFGETVQYMLPTVKQFPKLEPRFYNGIWLGKDTTTGKSLIGIYNKIGRARTIRRQIMPHKYNQQLLDQHCLHHKGKTALKTTSLCKKPPKTLQKLGPPASRSLSGPQEELAAAREPRLARSSPAAWECRKPRPRKQTNERTAGRPRRTLTRLWGYGSREVCLWAK